MRLAYGAATDMGLHRGENQDRYLADGTLFAVADGLGGYAGGATAAEIAVGVLGRAAPVRSLAQLIDTAGSANAEILEAARNNPHLSEMSTTLCALAYLADEVEPPQLAVVNVGDSRLYCLASDDFSQLTVDHTLVENLVRDGLLTRAEAATYRDRHALTRAVGFEPQVLVDGWTLRAVGDARFLICSDGITNEIPDSEIAEALRSVADPAEAAEGLVQAAVQPGRGRDNATAVVVDVIGPSQTQSERMIDLVLESRLAVAA